MKKVTLIALLGSTVLVSACNVEGVGSSVSYIDTSPKVQHNSDETSSANNVAPANISRNAVNAEITPEVKLAEITQNAAPTLSEILNKKITSSSEPVSEDDKLRYPAMKDTALTYGAQAGLAYASWQLNKMLQSKASKLDRIYDFNQLMTRGPDGVMVLPPIISEAKNLFEVTDEKGKSLRVADKAYEIIEQARFTSVAPMWHTYLIRDYQSPQEPPSLIYPKTQQEKDYWDEHLIAGWKAGEQQAKEIFASDLNRLDRDYQGMIRYLALLSEGKVSGTVLAKGNLGITGDGQTMRINDRTIRIMKDPELNLSTEQWTPTINLGPASTIQETQKEKTYNEFPRPIIRRY